MPGKQCNGVAGYSAGKLKNSKAYCEGLDHRISTNGATIGDNPHVAGSEAANCWDVGWSEGQADAGSTLSASSGLCCAPDRTKTIVA